MMDNDRQIPLKFLDEAADCCDRMESTVLGLANKIPNPQELDQALRAAHSIKGGAGMMGFMPLSQVAHQLEDFFKILRVRYHAKSIDTEVETLLLQGIDLLRQVSDLHRQGQAIDEAWLVTQSQPIFDQLRQQLGDLRPEDEDALLSQEGDADPAMLMLESALKDSIDLLVIQLTTLSSPELLESLRSTAEELTDFGRMAKLEQFVDLCRSVKDHCQNTDPSQATQLAQQSLKAWRKSHSVVLLGRFEKIPTKISGFATTTSTKTTSDNLAIDQFNPELSGMDDLTESIDFAFLQSEIANLDLEGTDLTRDTLATPHPSPLPQGEREQETSLYAPAPLLPPWEKRSAPVGFPDHGSRVRQGLGDEGLSMLSMGSEEQGFITFNEQFPSLESPFSEPPLVLLTEFAAFDLPEMPSALSPNWDESETATDISSLFNQNELSVGLLADLAAIELPELLTDWSEDDRATAPVLTTTPPITTPSSTAATIANASNQQGQTVRVPVEYLKQFNTAFGQLILERNAINLRLSEIQNYTGLLRKRMKHLELSNKELRQWYDQASTAGLIPIPQESSASVAVTSVKTSGIAEFDSLEMDQYNDLHLVSQDQMETIVQLEEVTTDIELSLQDLTQSVRGLNQTTRSLQKNLTRTQMSPFADVVKRFPRLIRDLSVQFGKSVNLKIVGEHTGIDRAILDSLSDPLIHLLRNAFDHGIEDVATRLAAGKSTTGNITLEASHRGSETIITIADDGGGIKISRIRDRLQQMGLPAEEIAKISEAELLDTIFEPGFSTASSLTELSGRGVGMDVVRTNIEEIRGRIQVKTELGIGTTFTIRVPFALSIVRVMLMERSGFIFAVSVDSVKEIMRFQPNLLTTDGSQLAWQSQTIPLLALEQAMTFGGTHRPFELPGIPTIDQLTVLVVGEDELSAAFYIDKFWGEKEVTLRSIDSPIPLNPGFGNSIILGDGRVVPLVNLVELACWMSVNAEFVTTRQDDGLMLVGTEKTQPQRILVIDDSINVRRYLAAMLEKEGYEVEQARDGQEAVEKLIGGLMVQAAICDVEMPRLDGYGVLEALRADETFENLPIIMLTSRNSEKHRTLAMNLGASAYFSKPYTEPELLGSLKSLIEESSPNLLAISR
jgi:two-component system, chemotaxis family, sensor histidine kinase and response regulator PixL